MTFQKQSKRHNKGSKVEFSYNTYSHKHEDNTNELNDVYQRIENVLTLYKIKNFKLSEDNDMEYNKRAIIEFQNIIGIYQSYIDRLNKETKGYNLENKMKIMEFNRNIFQ